MSLSARRKRRPTITLAWPASHEFVCVRFYTSLKLYKITSVSKHKMEIDKKKANPVPISVHLIYMKVS